jgi:RHS repeat-associated protein
LGAAQLIPDPTRAHSGSNYVQLSTPANAGVDVQTGLVAVNPGDQVAFGGWAYLESGSGGALGWWLAVYDGNHNPITYVGSSPGPSSGWTYESGTYTVPPNGAYVLLYAQIYLPSAPTVLRVDDGFLAIGRTATTVDNLDYLPFGEQIAGDTGTTHKFTGKERDAETGLDYFGARYYSGAQGRFTSPDAPFADQHPEDPQSWNLYAYTRNNPLAFVDDGGSQTKPATEVMISALPDGSVNHRFWDVSVGALKSLGRTVLPVLESAGLNRQASEWAEEALMPSNARQEMVMNVTDFAQDAEGAKALAAGGILVIRNPLALGQEITSLGKNIANNLKSLDDVHVGAALRELAGEVVKINHRDGQPYDHVTEVRNAAQGLTNSADRIKKLLGDPNLTGKARSALEGQLRQAKQKLGELRKTGIIP